ncbi:hypothetical protein HGRIS_006447 [Hohenbuehelia grisea]|uniref:NACHT domain-containing protein n=1 Tax=Hohenbuehelia grisea TaxID=104357 RepID=A0ABR3K1B5_9AGAR
MSRNFLSFWKRKNPKRPAPQPTESGLASVNSGRERLQQSDPSNDANEHVVIRSTSLGTLVPNRTVDILQPSGDASAHPDSADSGHRVRNDSKRPNSTSFNGLPSPGTALSQRNGWNLVKEALNVVEKFGDAFPPLKAAVGAVVSIMDHVERVEGNQSDFHKLADRIRAVTKVFTTYASNAAPSVLYDRLDMIVGELVEIQMAVEAKKSRHLIKRSIATRSDVQDLIDIQGRLASLLEVMNLQNTTETLQNILRVQLGIDSLLADSAFQKLNHVPEAGINAIPDRGCMAGTRVSVLTQLQDWSRDDNAPRICWLTGPAGTGKSCIARTFARSMRADALLGGSFFCHRLTSSRATVKRIIPTLAFFLARREPKFRRALLNILQIHDVASLPIDDQIECLLTQPLKIAFNPGSSTLQRQFIVLVIDALDECPSIEETRQLVKTLLSVAIDLPIKLFITSRPDPQMRNEFEARTAPEAQRRILRLHEIDQDRVHLDISHYLAHELDVFRTRFNNEPDGNLRNDWPSRQDIESLARLSGSLFIYAATALKFIQSEDPEKRLNKLLKSSGDVGHTLTGNIDQMYALVLAPAVDRRVRMEDEILTTKTLLACIIAAKEPLCLSVIAQLLSSTCAAIRKSLAPLHSVIFVPSTDDHGVISTYHTSFADFLTSAHRAPEDMHISLCKGHAALAEGCFNLLGSQLHFDVASCRSSHLPNSAQKLAPISPALKYASLSWPHHVVEANNSQHVASEILPQHTLISVEKFLSTHFLFWLEVLSATDNVNAASGLIMSIYLSKYTARSVWPSLRNLLFDANDFVVAFKEPIQHSIPHIYVSALPSLHESSQIAAIYQPKFARRATLLVEGHDDRCRHGRTLFCLVGHTKAVTSVAVSPDGSSIASGSRDGTIRVWNAETGWLVIPPLIVCNDWVLSLAFAPDGTRLVSGSSDRVVRMWYLNTGEMAMNPMEGHKGRVHSVAFSPDGAAIASGCEDHTIRIWDPVTGALLKQLDGHSDWVCSVLFSPDGSKIVSGSRDNTIRVWDVAVGECAFKLFEGHARLVHSISFSRDGKLIASGSSDQTIRVWEADTGDLAMEPIEVHASVTSVAFSPDRKSIVCGSTDKYIRIWSTSTGELMMPPLEGHGDRVSSVAYSSDGQRIISGSTDFTVRVWDASTDILPPTHRDLLVPLLQAHTNDVLSAAFSSDGKRIVSGSSDGTIFIWDSTTGGIAIPPLVHANIVHSVAFSPNGDLIASGSADGSVCIWNAITGQQMIRSSERHTRHTAVIRSVVFSTDGNQVISGSSGCVVCVWSTITGELEQMFRGHTACVRSVACSPDGVHIVSGSHDRTIRVWNATTGEQPVNPLRGHTSFVLSVVVSPDGHRILSGSFDETLRIWDASTGEQKLCLHGHTEYIRSVAFSPHGRFVVSSSDDRTIRLWDIATGKLAMQPLHGHTGRINTVGFSPDGMHIISTSSDHTIRIWDISLVETSSTSSHFPSPSEVEPPPIGTGILKPSNGSLASFYNAAADENDGWIRGPGGELLIWVLPEHRAFLAIPPCVNLMARTRITIDTSRLVHGLEWTKCWGS